MLKISKFIILNAADKLDLQQILLYIIHIICIIEPSTENQ